MNWVILYAYCRNESKALHEGESFTFDNFATVSSIFYFFFAHSQPNVIVSVCTCGLPLCCTKLHLILRFGRCGAVAAGVGIGVAVVVAAFGFIFFQISFLLLQWLL